MVGMEDLGSGGSNRVSPPNMLQMLLVLKLWRNP